MSIHIHHVEPGGTVDDEAALEQFQKQWTTYQKVVDHDSLSHREIGAILHNSLMAVPNPFNFLDIACGDAGQMSGALLGTCLLYTSPSPRDRTRSRMPSSA